MTLISGERHLNILNMRFTLGQGQDPGGQRVAMKEGGIVYFMLSDHLGSTTVTTESDGDYYSEIRYTAWGETRYEDGTTPTERRFTGQLQEASLGLYFFNARWVDPYLNRWIQPDPIIPDPGNPLDWDRFAYSRNNPVKYIDPSGHYVLCPQGGCHNPLYVFDYSDLGLGKFGNALAMTAIELVATPTCWLIAGCHIDWKKNVITGPTYAESLNNSLSGLANPIAMVASPWLPTSGSIFREFLPDNFRLNLMRLMGLSDEAIKGLQAHHILPQSYRSRFAELGLNVDDPAFGAWVGPDHQTWSGAYQNEWTSFFRRFEENNSTPSIGQIFAYAQSLAEKYQFEWTPPNLNGMQ